MKPWADEATKLSQDLDVTVRNHNQTLQSVTLATKGLTSKKLMETVQIGADQSVGVLAPFAAAIEELQNKMKNPVLM